MSVFIDQGVVPRDSRGDNFNRLGADLAKYLVVRKGDIVFNKLRTWQGGLGVSKFDGIVSPAYFVCRPRDNAEPRYLHYLLRSRVYLEELTRISKWMPPSQFDISWDDLRSLSVMVPPLCEQRAIADYLDRETARIGALIAAKRRMVALLEERFSTSRDGRLDALSAPTVPLGRFVVSIGQGVSPEAENRTAEPGEWAVLKLSAVKSGRYLPSEHKALPPAFVPRPDLVPRTGDLLVTRSNTPLLVGDVCAVTVSAPQVMLCDLIYVLRLRKNLDPEYAAQALLTRRSRFQLASAARGTSQSMVKLRGEDIRAVALPIPSLTEQRTIVTELTAERQRVDRMADVLDEQVILLHERRQALVTAAVTGQLDIPGAA